MKNRPQPKKISFIKVETKNNSKNKNNIKKQNIILNNNNNILVINSPKNKFIPSTNRYNEKLFNKIKKYSLEAHFLNQVNSNSTQNQNKINKIIKYNQEYSKYREYNNSLNNKNNEELRYNSLDIKNNIQKVKHRNNGSKIYSDRSLNPFIKLHTSIHNNKNIRINTVENEKDAKGKCFSSLTYKNVYKKPHSVSKERIKKNIISKKIIKGNLDIKFTKQNIIKKNMNIKRNISANNRMLSHRKINEQYFNNKENIRRDNEEEFNINYIEENDNLQSDIHISYNLTKKNPFNFYYNNYQYRSSKNMLINKNKKEKINFGIKEENENEDYINNLEFSFRKDNYNNNEEKKNIYISNSNDDNLFDTNSININKMKSNRNKKEKNIKERTLFSLNKKGQNYFDLSDDVLSENDYKEIYSPENLEYSLDNKRKEINLKNKGNKINKYFIFNKKGIYYNKKITNFENNKWNEKYKNLNNNTYDKNERNKTNHKEKSFYSKTRSKNKSKIENQKNSPTLKKFNNNSNYNYHNHKIYFLKSPNINISNLNKIKNENSCDDTFKKNKKIKYHKIIQNEKSQSKSQSKSHSKSRAKSHINQIENSNKYINRLNKIILLIKTNWGNIIKIGINNLKLLDKNNRNIPIKYANFDTSKPYIAKFIKGETKKLIIGYDKNYSLKHLVILNGFNDTGIKFLIIENDKGKVLWKGNIPKINMINMKIYYIPIDISYHNININNNINSKKNLLFSKTMFLCKDENTNITNFKHMSKTLRISKNNIMENQNKNYELCDKIKIKLISNYGNKNYIGLSGIEFFDNNNKMINIAENSKNIRINENIISLKEKKILYNLFNNKNDTTNPQYMFLTTNINAFINIEFKHLLKISKIIVYNYNNNNYKDCATKGILLSFYNNKKRNKINKKIYLYLPPGEENIDYGQILSYPFDKNLFFDKKIKENKIYLKLYNYKLIFNEEYHYYSPLFPFGYILKIEMISNYGNKNFIGMDNIQLFDIENNEINLTNSLLKNKITKDDKLYDYNNNTDNAKDNHINEYSNIFDIKPRIFLLPDSQKINPDSRPMILSKLHYFNDINNKLGENRIYFIFNDCITLSKVCIHNYNKYLDIATKEIKIFLDDKIIFEGELKNIEINNIYFSEKTKYNEKNKLKKMLSNTITLPRGINNSNNHFDKNLNFLGKTFDNKQNKNNYKIINNERYIEYEGKNGAKILSLNAEI